VVDDRGPCPEQTSDEHQDEVHPVPVEDVADTSLRARHAGEGEYQQRGGQRDERQQGVVGNEKRQHDRQHSRERL